MVTILTPIVPYFTPHPAAGFEALLGCKSSEARLAYGIVDGQLKRRVAVGQWKPKT